MKTVAKFRKGDKVRAKISGVCDGEPVPLKWYTGRVSEPNVHGAVRVEFPRLGNLYLAPSELRRVAKPASYYAVRERAARGGESALYLVKDQDGNVVGLLEKYPNTRTDRHPWKAFLGYGMTLKFLGAFYPEDGGRDAALGAVELGQTKREMLGYD